MKIAIGCYYSDNNKGDAAISLAMLKELRRAFPQATFTGLSVDSRTNSQKNFEREYRYEQQEFNVDVVGALFPPPKSAQNKQRLSKLWSHVCHLLCCFMYHLFLVVVIVLRRHAILLLRGEKKNNFEAIVDCDLLLLKGGGYIEGGPGGSLLGLYTDITRICRFCYSGYLALILGKPYILSACSIYGLNSLYAKWMIRKLVNGSAITLCRENLTYSHLLNIGCSPDKMTVTSDEAFALEPASEQEIKPIVEKWAISSSTKCNIGVTVVGKYGEADSDSPLGLKAEKYYQGIALVLNRLINEHDCRIFIMPQVIECSGSMRDSIAINHVMKYVERPDEVCVVTGDYHPRELIGIYGKMNFFIASRFHSGIFAAISGVPFVAIAYTVAKTEGIMEILKLSEAVFNFENLEADRLYELISRYLKGETTLWNGFTERIKGMITDANQRHVLYRRIYSQSLRKV